MFNFVTAFRHRRASHGERGQSLVEFALVLPIMAVLLLAIGDFARLYTTMITIESAAREPADFATLLQSQWDETTPPPPDDNRSKTVAEMERRACTASSHLPEYDGAADNTTCTNPTFSYELLPPGGLGESACADPAVITPTDTPCNVKVTLTYVFDLIVPVSLLGLDPTYTFQRTATFAISDFAVDQATP